MVGKWLKDLRQNVKMSESSTVAQQKSGPIMFNGATTKHQQFHD